MHFYIIAQFCATLVYSDFNGSVKVYSTLEVHIAYDMAC